MLMGPANRREPGINRSLSLPGFNWMVCEFRAHASRARGMPWGRCNEAALGARQAPSARGEKSHAEGLERLRGEQFFRFEFALGEPLLVVIAQERFQHVAVGLESVGPPVFAQLPASLLDVRDLPREHGGQRHGGS